VSPDTDIREAAQIMFDNKYGCLPVTVGDRLVGILTEADFVRFLARGD
jgi:CBS domain-containing membrane protein